MWLSWRALSTGVSRCAIVTEILRDPCSARDQLSRLGSTDAHPRASAERQTFLRFVTLFQILAVLYCPFFSPVGPSLRVKVAAAQLRKKETIRSSKRAIASLPLVILRQVACCTLSCSYPATLSVALGSLPASLRLMFLFPSHSLDCHRRRRSLVLTISSSFCSLFTHVRSSFPH